MANDFDLDGCQSAGATSRNLQTLIKTETALDLISSFPTIGSEAYCRAWKLLSDYDVYNKIKNDSPHVHRKIVDCYFPQLTEENSTVEQRVDRAIEIGRKDSNTGAISYPEELELQQLMEEPVVDEGVKARDRHIYGQIKRAYFGGVNTTWQFGSRGGSSGGGSEGSHGLSGTVTSRYDRPGWIPDIGADVTFFPAGVVSSGIIDTIDAIGSRIFGWTSWGSQTEEQDEDASEDNLEQTGGT